MPKARHLLVLVDGDDASCGWIKRCHCHVVSVRSI